MDEKLDEKYICFVDTVHFIFFFSLLHILPIHVFSF